MYNLCINFGMSSLNASSVAMLGGNILKNMDETKSYTTEEIDKLFIKESVFFENAVLRDQIYQLYALRLSVEAELE